jgi:hypothetical protein
MGAGNEESLYFRFLNAPRTRRPVLLGTLTRTAGEGHTMKRGSTKIVVEQIQTLSTLRTAIAKE